MLFCDYWYNLDLLQLSYFIASFFHTFPLLLFLFVFFLHRQFLLSLWFWNNYIFLFLQLLPWSFQSISLTYLLLWAENNLHYYSSSLSFKYDKDLARHNHPAMEALSSICFFCLKSVLPLILRYKMTFNFYNQKCIIDSDMHYRFNAVWVMCCLNYYQFPGPTDILCTNYMFTFS